MRLVPSLLLVAAVGAVPLGGCAGGSDKPSPPTPQQQVKAAAQKLLATRSPTVVCRTLVTRGFLQEVFAGDVNACADSEIADPPPEGRQVVTDVRVDGPEATVGIVQRGGDQDGLGGHYEFVRDGRAWKLDRFADDLVRSTLSVSFEHAGATTATGALGYGPLRTCAIKRVRALPIGDARALLSGLLSKAPGSKRKANAILVSCPDQLAGYVADRLSTALDEDGTKGQAWVDCMRRELDGLLLATGLAKDALEGNTSGAGTTAIGALTISANDRCARKAR